MDKETVDELSLRLKGPIVAMERIANGITLPQVFADAALEELLRAKELLVQLDSTDKM